MKGRWMRRSVVIVVATVVLLTAVVALLFLKSSTPYPLLSAKLLGASEVPSAWQPESFQKAAPGTGCLSTVMSPRDVRQTAEVNALYINDGSVPPELGEAIATFRDTKSAYSKIITTLEACKYINGGNPNPTGIYGSVGKLNLPTFGDSSEAFIASITAQAVPVTVIDDIIVIEKGNYVLEIYEANLGVINHQRFEHYISKALSKI
jgi:hypothetical protein